MKDIKLFTFTLRDLIICFSMFVTMLGLIIIHDMIPIWANVCVQVAAGILLAIVMIITDNKLKGAK